MLHSRVSQLFADLSKLEPLENVCRFFQIPGTSDNVFLLEKTGDHYFLLPSPMFYEPQSTAAPPPPSVFNRVLLYVVLVAYPQQVMVGIAKNREGRETQPLAEKHEIHGHTSITFEEDVLYAGELLFEEERLVQWNNFSGHYMPEDEDRFTQLTPNVKRLLPESLFCEEGDFLRRQ